VVGGGTVSEWREKPLGQVARLSWGDTSTTKASYAPSGWPAYSASGRDGFLPHFDHEEDAVVISAIGALCGKTWLARGRWSCIKNTMWMRALPGEADNRFLYHATRRSDFWPRRGAAQPFISLGDARSTLVELPPVGTQRRIAAVLSAFDELIEINERRIEVLEALARSLHREWFVRFRFPGHEGVDLTDSELGLIPRGWEVRRLGDVAEFTSGSAVTKAAYVTDGYPAFSASGPDGFLGSYDVEGRGVVLSAVGARCGRTFRAAGRWSAISNTIRYRPRGSSCGSAWLFLATSGSDLWPKRGSAQPFISINDARGVKTSVPESPTMTRFEGTVVPIFDLIDGIDHESRRLATTRDLLLPRLVTGRVDISDIDLGELLPPEAA
jgi:type I restriction enzyme S subunit